MPIDHVLRICVRIHVGSYHREADLTIPASSTFSEVLGDITDLCNAPKIDRPWQVATVSGKLLDLSRPIAATGLKHGSIIVLSPRLEENNPVFRDSAEALVHAAENTTPLSLSIYAPIPGALLLCFIVAAFPITFIPLPIRFLVVLLGFLLLLLRHPEHRTFSIAALISAVALGFSLPQFDVRLPEFTELHWHCLTVSALLLATCAALYALRNLSTGLGAGVVGVVIFLMLIALCVASGMSSHAVAAAISLCGLLLILLAPSCSIYLAGLRVPRLPSAGQSFQITDEPIDDVDNRAIRAGKIHDGTLCAVMVVLTPALLVVGFSAGPWATILLLSIAAATGLHALRYRRNIGKISLLSIAFSALAGAMLSAYHSDFGIYGAIFSILVSCFIASAPLWSSRISEIQPTTLVWLERAESAALIIAIPLSLHLMGVFSLLRGMG